MTLHQKMIAAQKNFLRVSGMCLRAAKADRANIQREVESALAEKIKAESEWQIDFDARKKVKAS